MTFRQSLKVRGSTVRGSVESRAGTISNSTGSRLDLPPAVRQPASQSHSSSLIYVQRT